MRYKREHKKKLIYCLFALLLILVSCSERNTYKLLSPNGNIQLTLSNKDNKSQFIVVINGDTLLQQNALGLLVNEKNFTKNISYTKLSETEFDETWSTVNGKQTTVRNYYKEYTFRVDKEESLKLSHQIVFRLYNQGFAYRYSFPTPNSNDSILINKELTQLNFTNDFKYWAYNGEHHNLGPIKRSEKNIKKVRPPMVMQFSKDRFIAMHEAEIIEFAPFSINAKSSDGTLSLNTNYSSRNTAFKTSWRAFMIGDKIGDLVESNLLVNLNEPCKIKAPSWIKPGKAMWDWRVWGYKTKDGFEYGLNTKSHLRFIDFAAENNIQHLLIDADWYGEEFNENSDPTSARKEINIETCMKYANKKGVGVILYLNDVGAKKFGLERVLKQFSDWGAVGVKYGFMQGTLEEKVKHTRKVVELCARYKLMVNFHDNPIPPSGDRRTYPNLITKEFGHSQADAKRSYYPETAVNQPLINMISGPLDMCNGWFALNNAHQEGRPRVFQEIPGTVAAEVAKLITIYTGCAVLPDSPEEYKKKPDLFECIRQIPPQFDNYKVLDARLDEYVCIARKSVNNWFIGSLTNRKARSIDIDLSFLPKEKKYEATLYEDAKDSHFLYDKESYVIRKQILDFESKLSINLAPGGGHVMFLREVINNEQK